MARTVLSWRRTAVLPQLSPHTLEAKLDTGSRGTVLHATRIAVRGGRVLFTLHPGPELTIAADAELSDMRRVTSSNGAAELRPFIRTPVALAGLPALEVEVSLSGRASMRFPMLIGRTALAGWGVLVDPAPE